MAYKYFRLSVWSYIQKEKQNVVADALWMKEEDKNDLLCAISTP